MKRDVREDLFLQIENEAKYTDLRAVCSRHTILSAKTLHFIISLYS